MNAKRPQPTPADPPAPRVTKRRAETRARLLEAALEVFAERGFGRTRIEQVCERAGYTRGAFYSQFDSLDELFLELYEQRAAAVLAGLRSLASIEIPDQELTVRDGVALVLGGVRDDDWYRVGTEFGMHALRNPELRDLVAARNAEFGAALMPIFEQLLARAGRTVTDRTAFAEAMIAVDVGTTLQCLVEPDDPAVSERRLDLLVAVVMAYTKSIDS